MLGHTEPVVDRGVAARGVQPGGGADLGGGDAGVDLGRLGAVLLAGDERRPARRTRPGSQRSATKRWSTRSSVTIDVRERVDDRRRSSPGGSWRKCAASTCGAADEVDPARVDDDQPRAVAQPPLHPRGEHRVGVGRVRADQQDHVGSVDRAEVLRSRRGAERRASARSRSASGRPGRRCRRCCSPNAARTSFWTAKTSSFVQRDDVIPPIALLPVAGLDVEQPACGGGDRLVPRHRAPRRRRSSRGPSGSSTRSRWRRVAPCEAALDARVTLVRAAVLGAAPSARPGRPAARPGTSSRRRSTRRSSARCVGAGRARSRCSP